MSQLTQNSAYGNALASMDDNYIKEFKLRLDKFMGHVSKEPRQSEIKKNTQANNVDFIPISFIETTLDELFLGQWSTEDFHYSVIANEIVGHLTLKFIHPISGQWISRVGVGAVPIRMAAGAAVDEFQKKIKTALMADLPHMKAECLKNAAKGIGKVFGRDLNRKAVDSYQKQFTSASSLDKAVQ